jgi:glycosyltransferase involved in cell wall biosynthesis
MDKNVLFLSYDGMTDPLGQSQVLPYLRKLSEEGYHMHLISFEKPERYALHQKTIEKICVNANIQWHPMIYTKRPPIFSTIYDIYRMWQFAQKIIKVNDVKLLHCRSYIAAMLGFWSQEKYKTKFLFDMRGFWADERVDGGLWKLSNPLYKYIYSFFKKKETAYFTNADHTISLTHNGKNEIHSWKHIKSNPIPIQVIPCCVDLHKFNPNQIIKPTDTSIQHQLKDKFVIGYIGSIGTWYMLDEMLDFFKVFKTKKPNAVFLFITMEHDLVMNKLAEKSINVQDVIITSCLHSEVPYYTSLMDMSVFFIRPTFSKKASSPTKQGEIMAMGVPIICNAGVGDTDKVILDYEAGEIVNEFNEVSYSSVIDLFLSKSYDRDKIKHGAEEFYSLESGAKKYKEVYKKLIG